MKPWLYGLAAALALAAPAAAQPAPGHVFSPEMAARVDHIAQAEVAGGRTPGIAIGIVEDGRLVYARGFGYADVAKRHRVDPATQFYLGNVSAQFTTGAVLLLVQDGKLKLDDRVTKYVPELTIAGNVTIAELLQQTSGLPDYTKAPGISGDQTHQIKINDLIAAANKMQLAATPGTAYAANDFNFVVAGLVVERVSGVTLSDFLQQRIFLPLVMNQTFYAGDSGISPAHAVGYSRSGSASFATTRPLDATWLLGARGVVSNVYDLAKWDIEMPILLRVDAVRDMYTAAGAAGPAQHGMGWVIDRRGGKLFVWYAGEIPGYRAINAVLPDDHLAVIVLTNADSLHGAAVTSPAMIASRVLDVAAPPVTVRLDNAIVARAKEWLERIADKQIDRTELTPAFSTFLSDDLVASANFAAYGKLQTIVPISSTTEPNGDTLYEFVVQYPHDQFHYKFAVTQDGKIDELLLGP
jgi:CubicO group peptidase (beta-lactamase class C family)